MYHRRMMTPQEVAQERMDRLARVFARADRVLSGDEVECEVIRDNKSGPNAPAWNDGRLISFNADMIGDITDVDDIIMITGLNYHELSHVMFTPRAKKSRFREQIMKEGYHTAFNILEDQRIETLMTGKFKATEPYFVSTFMRFCMTDEKSWDTNFLLAYGRRYLAQVIRDEFEKRFEQPQIIDEAKDIIDEYRLMVIHNTKMDQRAFDLVERFHDLLTQINGQPGDPFGHMVRGEIDNTGNPLTKGEQEEAAEWAEWYESEEEADSDDKGSKGGSGDDSDSDRDDDSVTYDGDGDGTDSEDDDGDADGDGDSDGDEGGKSGKPGEADTDAEGGYAPGSGEYTPPANDFDFRKIMEEERKRSVGNRDVQRDAKDAQQQVVRGDGKITHKLDWRDYTETQSSPQAVLANNKFGKELERLRADMDPGWHTHRSSGRLNVKRAMQGGDMDTVFDVWDHGVHDATDIEAVICIDYSISMGHRMYAACEALWIIKRALEKVGGDVTVFGFSDSSIRIYDAEEKAAPNKYRHIGASGSTNPADSIQEGFRILANSRRQHLLFILITDGEWYYFGDEIPRMNRHGATTALAYIGDKDEREEDVDDHGCQIKKVVSDPYDLVPFAKDIVTNIMKTQKVK